MFVYVHMCMSSNYSPSRHTHYHKNRDLLLALWLLNCLCDEDKEHGQIILPHAHMDTGGPFIPPGLQKVQAELHSAVPQRGLSLLGCWWLHLAPTAWSSEENKTTSHKSAVYFYFNQTNWCLQGHCVLSTMILGCFFFLPDSSASVRYHFHPTGPLTILVTSLLQTRRRPFKERSYRNMNSPLLTLSFVWIF